MIDIPEDTPIQPLIVEQRDKPVHCCMIQGAVESVTEPWFHDILKFVQNQEYPEGASKNEKLAIRRLAARYIVCGDRLYRRSYDGIHLLCVTKAEAEEIIEEVHGGACAPHMNGHMLARKILRLGYFWTTMEADCVDHVKKCHVCQIHGNLNHLPPVTLYNMVTPWPFSTWGIDIIGKVTPKASNGHEFILVAIDYFTKWVEAASYAVLNSKKVASFIQTNIICRYGVPREIISDNGSHFKDQVVGLLAKYQIHHHKSSPYRPQTNGAVEAANKNLETILRKSATHHRDWAERIPYALWGYRTSIRTSTGATPYALVYGMEAVLPVEVEIPSLRVMFENEVAEAEWTRSRYDQLNLTDEKRLKAMYNIQGYQKRMARAFNKRVKDRGIVNGDLVLKEIRAPTQDPRGKFKPKWSGPFLVKKIFSGGAVRLVDLDGIEFKEPVNLDQLKKYYA